MVGKSAKGGFFYRIKIKNPNTLKVEEKYKAGFTSKRDAREAGELLVKKILENPVGLMTLKTIVDDYISNDKVYNTSTTTAGKERIFRIYILPTFGDMPLDKITKMKVRQWMEEIQKDPKTAPRYKNDITAHFKYLFKHAETYFNLKDNPCVVLRSVKENVEVDKVGKIMSREEFEKFESCFEGSDNEQFLWKTFYNVLFNTGARRGEVQALRFTDIDYVSKTINFNKTVSGKYTGEKPKVRVPKTPSSIRTIPLDDQTFEMIKRVKDYRTELEDFDKLEFIFGRPDDRGLPFSDTTIERLKNKAIKSTGITRIRIHDFRHSHASELIGNGVNIVVVSKRLGHSSIDMTLKVYTHLMPTADKEAINFINNKRKK